MAPATRRRAGVQQVVKQHDDQPVEEATLSSEKECLIANRIKLREASEIFSRGDLLTRIKAAAFQASYLCGSYLFDTWESIFVFAVYSLLLTLMAIGAARQLRLLF